jgi:hypothetical protein
VRRAESLSSLPAQCSDCVRWTIRGGSVLPPVVGCTWIAGDDDQVTTLMAAVAMHLARAGECPGRVAVDVHAMPDSYRAADLPRGGGSLAEGAPGERLEDEHA